MQGKSFTLFPFLFYTEKDSVQQLLESERTSIRFFSLRRSGSGSKHRVETGDSLAGIEIRGNRSALESHLDDS